MKTTITIPDTYHKMLRKISIYRSMTLTDLVSEAIRKTFFSAAIDDSVNSQTADLPFNQLHGMMRGSVSSKRDIGKLKKIWNKK